MSSRKLISARSWGSRVHAVRPSVVRSTGSFGGAVDHLQDVVWRHHQRPRGERVRRDERDHVAGHPPRQHGAPVGQVVARRPGGGGHHQAVAAHLAELLALDRVAQLGHPQVLAPVEGDVVHRDSLARGGLATSAGTWQHLELAAQRPPEGQRPGRRSRRWPGTRSRRSSWRTPARRGPANRRMAVRIVPSPPMTTARSVGASGSAPSTAPGSSERPCFSTSSAGT